jgi:hypothetical protein
MDHGMLYPADDFLNQVTFWGIAQASPLSPSQKLMAWQNVSGP